VRDASDTAAGPSRLPLPLSLEGLLERMNRRGVVEVVVPLPLEHLLACATPAGLARELARRVAGDPALMHLVEWEPVDVEHGAVLLLVRAIAPEAALRVRLADESGGEDHQADHDDRDTAPAGEA